MLEKIVGSGRKVAAAAIDEFERKCNVRLAEDYRAFLLSSNGGRPRPKFFEIKGCRENSRGQVQDFFGLEDEVESCDLLWNYRMFKDRLKGGLLPIGCEDGGSLICMRTTRNACGAVVYWDFRTGVVYEIANSFTEFLAGLHDFDPLEVFD